jgi:hypothetical protein
MVFPENHPDHLLRGNPKGADKNVDYDGFRFHLECPKSGGREGCQAKRNIELVTGCCARGVVAKEPDLHAQRGRRLVEELDALNPRVIFYPKSHCEFKLH